MVTDEKLMLLQGKFQEAIQLYRALPDTRENRENVERDIERIGLEVMREDWDEVKGWVKVNFLGRQKQIQEPVHRGVDAEGLLSNGIRENPIFN